jgi:UDP-2-acetamido-2,6-beta-L-arabino-hexul-4-ose reductase
LLKDSIISVIGESCLIPDLSDQFGRKLYATYLSYLPSEKRKVSADIKADERGILFELIKSYHAGQIFISKTKPGVTRGNHYHHTKTEKFCVLSGRAMIRMRRIDSRCRT